MALLAACSRELPDLFELQGFRVIVEKHDGMTSPSRRRRSDPVNVARYHTVAVGKGPVNALDNALRKALRPKYPELDHLELVDYKVRVLEGTVGTATPVRVLIQTTDGEETWAR